MNIDWVAVQAVATVTLVATSLGAIGYAGLQLKHEREYRGVANLEKQLTYFLGPAFSAARQRLATARLAKVTTGDGEPATLVLAPWDVDDPPISAFEVLDFYEHLALLVKKGHLELYDVWHTFYEWAQPVYVDLRPLIEGAESAYRDHYVDFQRMMRQMDTVQLKKMHARQANHWALWTSDRILEHYRYELEVGIDGRPRYVRRQGSQPVERTAA